MVSDQRAGLRRWHHSVRKTELEAAWSKLSSGGGSGRDGISPAKFGTVLAQEIRLINRRLRHLEYRFQPYVQILKSKGAEKSPRIISMPAVRDRLALRVMALYLRAVYPSASIRLPQDIIAAVIAALDSGQWRFFIKLDVQNFYPSIDHQFLKARLQQVQPSPRIVAQFMAAGETATVARSASRPTAGSKVGVPQGLAISNGLAELVMKPLDDHLSSNEDICGFRFVDDILIFGKSERALQQAGADVRRIAALAGLRVHDETNIDKSSSGALPEAFDFLGYSFEWPRISVRSGSITKLESRIARTFTAYKYSLARNVEEAGWRARCRDRLQWHLDLVVSGFVLDGRRVGWLAYFSQIRNLKLLRRLDVLVSQKAARFGVGDMAFKSFVHTYRLVSSRREDESGYIPNFDKYAAEEMRNVLTRIFNQSHVDRLSDDEVRARFYRRVKRLSKDLEADTPSYH